MQTGPKNLITDIAGLRVGNCEDRRLKSGVTVILCDQPATAAVHIMGGAPGTRETDLLEPHNTVQTVDAITLAGGSAFGLDAASGVQAALKEMGRGFAVGPLRVPIVPAAILFDLLNGGDKAWGRYPPYRELGYEAVQAAAESFELGTHGAGTGPPVSRAASARPRPCCPTASRLARLRSPMRWAASHWATAGISAPRSTRSATSSAASACLPSSRQALPTSAPSSI